MLRATKGISRSRRAAALLLAICMTMMTILPSLATPAKAIAGVDDVAVAAFVATLFVGTGVTIQHVTSSEAFQSAVVSYWNKTVTTSSEIYKSFTRWLRDGYVTLKQSALQWIYDAEDSFVAASTVSDSFSVDSAYSSLSNYLGSLNGIPYFNTDTSPDYEVCPTLGSFLPTVTSVTENCGYLSPIPGETYYLVMYNNTLNVSSSGKSYSNTYFPASYTMYYGVKHYTGDNYYMVGIYVNGRNIHWCPNVMEGTSLYAIIASLMAKTYVAPTADVAISKPDTWTVNTEDLQPDPEKDDKHQPIAFVPFIPHWSNQDLLNKLLDGTAKPEMEITTAASKGLDITDVTENEDTDHVNYTPLVTAASGITEVFPFCIPFDLVKIAKNFNVAAVAPVWTVTLFHDIGFDLPITLDFTPYNDLFEPFRILETIFFMIGLALITYKMIKW